MVSFIPGRGVTEYGEMFHGIFDAWGRGSVDSVLFDGTKITAILVDPVDAGMGAESVDVSAVAPVSDTCAGVETVNMTRECGDYGAGVESISVVNIMQVCEVPLFRRLTVFGDICLDGVDEWGHRRVDSMLEDGMLALLFIRNMGVEAVGMAHEVIDSSAGVDAVNMAHEVIDSSAGVDAVNMAHEAADSGMGLDAVNMAREIVDAGAGFDAIYVVASVAVDESAIGIEYAIISPVALDSGAGAEAVTMRKEVLDFGVGVDVPDWFISIYGMVLIDNDDVGIHSILYKDWRQKNIPVQVHRRSVSDKVYIDSDEIGDVVVEWEDRVSDVIPGERTLIVTGVVELYD